MIGFNKKTTGIALSLFFPSANCAPNIIKYPAANKHFMLEFVRNALQTKHHYQ
jgi:hypothetical protein